MPCRTSSRCAAPLVLVVALCCTWSVLAALRPSIATPGQWDELRRAAFAATPEATSGPLAGACCCYGGAACPSAAAAASGGSCHNASVAPFCAGSQDACENHCNGRWCGPGHGPTPPPPAPPSPPRPAGSPPLPADLINVMHVGINLGNTLEAPTEGAWAPPATEALFDAYKAAGFKFVRVPVRWDNHTGRAAPYTIDGTWMDRVAEVVGWSVRRGLITILNTHHDVWLDDPANFDAMLPRFEAIWTQVAARFAPVNDSLLIFEVFNEPHLMTADNLNAMNAAALPIIRKTNPTRTVLFGGLAFMNPSWILSNPDALKFPDQKVDPYVALEIHNYDPVSGPDGAAMQSRMVREAAPKQLLRTAPLAAPVPCRYREPFAPSFLTMILPATQRRHRA